MRSIQRISRGWLPCGLASAVLLLGNGISEAQTRTTTGGGSSLTGGQGGTGQGGTGQGGQGSASQGSNFSQGLSLGTNSPTGFAGSNLQQSFKLRSNSSTNIGVGSPIGQYYNNPLALGLPTSSGARGGFATPLYGTTGGGSGQSGGTTFGGSGGFGGTTGSVGGTSSVGGAGGTRSGGTGGSTGSFGGSSGSLGGGSTGSFGGGATGSRGGAATGGGLGGAGGFGGTSGGLGGGIGGGQGTALGGARTGQGGIGGGLTGGGLTGGFGNTIGSVGGRTGGALGGTTSQTGSGRRSFPYTIGFVPPAGSQPTTVVAPLNFNAELQGVLVRSSSLRSAQGIQVGTQGPVVVLRGKVTSERERDLAEALLRLTPGVREISNELQVEEDAPPPKPIP